MTPHLFHCHVCRTWRPFRLHEVTCHMTFLIRLDLLQRRVCTDTRKRRSFARDMADLPSQCDKQETEQRPWTETPRCLVRLPLVADSAGNRTDPSTVQPVAWVTILTELPPTPTQHTAKPLLSRWRKLQHTNQVSPTNPKDHSYMLPRRWCLIKSITLYTVLRIRSVKLS